MIAASAKATHKSPVSSQVIVRAGSSVAQTSVRARYVSRPSTEPVSIRKIAKIRSKPISCAHSFSALPVDFRLPVRMTVLCSTSATISPAPARRLQLQFLQLLAERVAVETEQIGGADLVAARCLHGNGQQRALDL